MIVRDWFDWSNAGVGLAGLALTVGAIWQATGAKSAAQEARRAVYQRNSAEDINRVLGLALDFSTALQMERDELALHIAPRFISICSSARERYRGFLGVEGGKLEMASELVATASRRIQPGADKNSLIADAQRVVRLVSSVTGVLNRDIDEEKP
ncbi:MAG TPA: hypothetical protein VE291_14095 [Terracidiphilus sp.]|nr:hypothetical protein [Terracidiphilus sp.]